MKMCERLLVFRHGQRSHEERNVRVPFRLNFFLKKREIGLNIAQLGVNCLLKTESAGRTPRFRHSDHIGTD